MVGWTSIFGGNGGMDPTRWWDGPHQINWAVCNGSLVCEATVRNHLQRIKFLVSASISCQPDHDHDHNQHDDDVDHDQHDDDVDHDQHDDDVDHLALPHISSLLSCSYVQLSLLCWSLAILSSWWSSGWCRDWYWRYWWWWRTPGHNLRRAQCSWEKHLPWRCWNANIYLICLSRIIDTYMHQDRGPGSSYIFGTCLHASGSRIEDHRYMHHTYIHMHDMNKNHSLKHHAYMHDDASASHALASCAHASCVHAPWIKTSCIWVKFLRAYKAWKWCHIFCFFGHCFR